MDAKKIGTFISSKRNELGLTQEELGSKIDVTGKAISRWERGVGLPDISLLEPLSTALGVSVLELMRGETMEKENNTSEVDVLKETVEYLKLQRRRVRILVVLSYILSVATFILGSYVLAELTPPSHVNILFRLLLVTTMLVCGYTLGASFRIKSQE